MLRMLMLCHTEIDSDVPCQGVSHASQISKMFCKGHFALEENRAVKNWLLVDFCKPK